MKKTLTSDFLIDRFVLQLLRRLGGTNDLGARYSKRNVIRHSPMGKLPELGKYK